MNKLKNADSVSVIQMLLQSNFIEITLWLGCSLVNLLLFSEHLVLRTSLEGYFWFIFYVDY